jgi:hypothetical protein
MAMSCKFRKYIDGYTLLVKRRQRIDKEKLKKLLP